MEAVPPTRGAMRPVRLPLLLLLLLAVALAVTATQGLRMARDRQERLLPARAPLPLPLDGGAAERAVDAGGARFLAVDLGPQPPARLGLYQLFPERSLVRWVEPPGLRGSLLVLPLEGLEAGSYALAAVDPDARAGPREMDQPPERLDIRLRLRLSR